MGRLTLKLEAVPPADQQQADFVVLDNDLPQSGLSATVLAARLLQLGFSGLTAVLTGAAIRHVGIRSLLVMQVPWERPRETSRVPHHLSLSPPTRVALRSGSRADQ
jgi:hypothetical protein